MQEHMYKKPIHDLAQLKQQLVEVTSNSPLSTSNEAVEETTPGLVKGK